MREMVDALGLKQGDRFTRGQAVAWFEKQYPRIKRATVTAHLTRLSTNAPSRIHYGARAEEDDLFYQLDSTHFRLYDSKHDPMPIHGSERGLSDEAIPEEEEVVQASESFAYERDLQNYLGRNLDVIETGLRLYEDEGITGIEFPVGGRFIDILAVDRNGDLVVIELKVSRGYDRVVGQLMRYMAWIERNLAESDQKVRGVIVARQMSEDLMMACSMIPSVQLFEYALSLSLRRVKTR
jgi:endonuclease